MVAALLPGLFRQTVFHTVAFYFTLDALPSATSTLGRRTYTDDWDFP